MNTVSKAILATLLYGDVFDSALDFQQLYDKLQCSKPVSKKQLAVAAEILIEQRLIVFHLGYYCLAGRERIIDQSREKITIFERKLVYANQILKPIAWLPFVVGVFITGSLAVKNSSIDDDIDLLIVTKKNRMWLSRFLLTILYELLGVRKRPHATDVKDKLCFNMFLESDALAVPVGKRNLYTAYEVIQALPVLDRQGVSTSFIIANSWIADYFGNAVIGGKQQDNICNRFTLFGLTGDLLNTILYRIQIWYMKRKKTSEFVVKNRAFFHPRPTNEIVLNALKAGKKRFGLV